MITVERLPNGYWRATIRLLWPPDKDYVQTESSFHDEDEARDWAEMMVGFLTRDEQPPCEVCGGRGWHTAGGNDPAACGACPRRRGVGAMTTPALQRRRERL